MIAAPIIGAKNGGLKGFGVGLLSGIIGGVSLAVTGVGVGIY